MMITFITRHYPPNSNINGESVCDMVEYLEAQYGIKSNVICIDRQADGVANTRPPAGTVYRVKTLYKGQNALLRFITFLYDGFMLTRKALQFKDTVIICTTSPPLLPMWAALLFSKKIHWAMWSFDLFPEGFKVTHFIGDKNPLYRLALKVTYNGQPTWLIALGEQQAIFLQKAYQRAIPTVILPCGVFFYQDLSDIKPDWYDPNFTWLGYCGNVGDPHNPAFIQAAIDHLNPAKQRLVLALYGNQAAAVKAYALGKPGVVIVDRVPRNQLHFIDIHLVSLRTEWTHVAVPSKAISAVFMGASVLFCGNQESDNWQMLQNAGWIVEDNETMETQVATFLSQITAAEVAVKRAAAPAIQTKLQNYVKDGYAAIKGWC